MNSIRDTSRVKVILQSMQRRELDIEQVAAAWRLGTALSAWLCWQHLDTPATLPCSEMSFRAVAVCAVCT